MKRIPESLGSYRHGNCERAGALERSADPDLSVEERLVHFVKHPHRFTIPMQWLPFFFNISERKPSGVSVSVFVIGKREPERAQSFMLDESPCPAHLPSFPYFPPIVSTASRAAATGRRL